MNVKIVKTLIFLANMNTMKALPLLLPVVSIHVPGHVAEIIKNT
jgi:hypothetical protein